MSELDQLQSKIFPAPWSENREAVKQWVNELPRPLVFTNGCFDILHRGHITYLSRAADLGRSLLIAVNDDDSVRAQQKGEGRPFNPLQDRMILLAALGYIDGVIAFGEQTPRDLIKVVRPDILVKGGDWAPDQIVGADEVRSWGGSVHSIAFEVDRSTTALVERIRSISS